MSVIEYIRYSLKPGTEEAFVDAYDKAQGELAAAPSCLGWDLARGHESPERFILRIEWTSVEDHLERFRRSEVFKRFLGHVRPYIDDIEEMSHYHPTRVASATPSICDALGGPAVLFKIADTMHEQMKVDDVLGQWFSRAAPTHVPHLGMWLCEVFGGPKLWSAVYPDIGHMLRKHAGKSIEEKQRVRFVEIATRAVAQCAPDSPEPAQKAVAEYFDWGSKVAVANSQPDHVLDVNAGVPSWSMDDATGR